MGLPLDAIHRLLLKSVLETTIDQLAIVGGTLPASSSGGAAGGGAGGGQAAVDYQGGALHPNVSSQPLEELLVRERKILQRKCNKAHEGRAMALKRLAAEAGYVQHVLEDTLEEVVEFGTFSAMFDSVKRSEERQEEKNRISEAEKSIRHEINDLKASIVDARERSNADILRESLLIARLKDGLLEARRSTKGEEDFTQELEAVREQERVRFLEDEERGLAEKRDNLKRDIEHEQRVTIELESWLNDRRSHLRAQHKHWTEKLKGDLAQRDLDLQELTAARESDIRRREDANVRMETATRFVREELERRRKAKMANERRQLEVRTAIKIQAWWRMVMVRRNLGPFRKRKPKQPKQQKRF